jgi:amidohydrolase
MVEEGALDGVDAAFALHAWPTVPIGKLGVGTGLIMASADMFTIKVHGKGGHAADPGSVIDPGLVAAHIVVALQSIVARELNPWEAGVLSVTRIASGTNFNVIPDVAILEGTFRALDTQRRDEIAESLHRIATATAQAFRATAEVHIQENGYPALYNDPAMSSFAQRTIAEQFGDDALIPVKRPHMASEDFAFYLQKIQGAYIFLGNNEPGTTDPPLLHSPHFNFNDNALPVAIEMMAAIAKRFLSHN